MRNYFFRSINPLDEWNLFSKKEGNVTSYYGHSKMKIGDIVLLCIGKQDDSLKDGVYGIGKVLGKVYKEDGRYRVKIKLIKKAKRNEPFLDGATISYYSPNQKRGIRSCEMIYYHKGELEKMILDLL